MILRKQFLISFFVVFYFLDWFLDWYWFWYWFLDWQWFLLFILFSSCHFKKHHVFWLLLFPGKGQLSFVYFSLCDFFPSTFKLFSLSLFYKVSIMYDFICLHPTWISLSFTKMHWFFHQFSKCSAIQLSFLQMLVYAVLHLHFSSIYILLLNLTKYMDLSRYCTYFLNLHVFLIYLYFFVFFSEIFYLFTNYIHLFLKNFEHI